MLVTRGLRALNVPNTGLGLTAATRWSPTRGPKYLRRLHLATTLDSRQRARVSYSEAKLTVPELRAMGRRRWHKPVSSIGLRCWIGYVSELCCWTFGGRFDYYVPAFCRLATQRLELWSEILNRANCQARILLILNVAADFMQRGCLSSLPVVHRLARAITTARCASVHRSPRAGVQKDAQPDL